MNSLEGGPKTDRRLIVAVAVVALIVIAGFALILSRALGGSNEPATTGSGEPTNEGSSSVCGLPDGDQNVPTDAPPTSWYFIGKVAAPEAETIGPGRKSGAGVRSCFAHNPAGALFAAATLAAEIYQRDDLTRASLEARSVPGPELDDALGSDLGSPGPPSQIVGFRFDDYTSERATVTLATQITEGPNRGAIGATPMTLVWQDADWLLQLGQASEPLVLNSLEGFIKWSGVS